MPRHKKNILDGIPVEVRPAEPGGNPLNPYDHISPEERHRRIVAIYAKAYLRLAPESDRRPVAIETERRGRHLEQRMMKCSSNQKLMPDRFEGYERDLSSLEAHFLSNRQRIQALYPLLPIDGDVRFTAFSKCQNLFSAVNLGIGFRRHVLARQDFMTKLPTNDRRIIVSQFEGLMKMGFVGGLFSSVESSLRSVVRALDASACNQGNASFKSIYDWLFARLGLRHWETMMDFFREVRNSIHNNSVFFSKDGQNKSRVFEGKTYLFKVGSVVDFMDWDLSFRLGHSAGDLLVEVMAHADVGRISAIPELGPRLPL